MKGHQKGCLGGGRGELYSIFFKKTYFLGFFLEFGALGFCGVLVFVCLFVLLLFSTK